MYLVQQVTSAPFQTQTLILPDGTSFSMTLAFYPQQYAWFIVEIVYQSFVLQSVQLTTSPNMLHQFRNQIPFGLGCECVGNREPSQQFDFSSGAARLFVLSEDEVKQYNDVITGES